MLEDAERRELEGMIKAEMLAKLRELLAKTTAAIHEELLWPAGKEGEWHFEDDALEAECLRDISLWEVLRELLKVLYQQFFKVKQYIDEAQRKLLRDKIKADAPSQPIQQTRAFKL